MGSAHPPHHHRGVVSRRDLRVAVLTGVTVWLLMTAGQRQHQAEAGGSPQSSLVALQGGPPDEPVKWEEVHDAKLSEWLDQTSKMSKMSLCHADKFTLDDNTTQIFLWKWMRYLYTIYSKTQPQYILDADATIVSVEPNTTNFRVLEKNTEGMENVNLLHAGLWGKMAKIGLAGFHGAWGNVFKEVGWKQKGLQAYSVKDIAKMFDIPAFDMVKIDIEGAEGMVFAPGTDLSWVDDVKVGVMEVHDWFAGYFGLRAVGSRVKNAFDERFDTAWDNEHVVFMRKSFTQELRRG
eukprot:scaffold5.g1000.t1